MKDQISKLKAFSTHHLWLGLSLAIFMAACASDPLLHDINNPSANIGGAEDDIEQDFEHPENPLETCESGLEGEETFGLTVDAAEAFNVVFILDDSLSMDPQIESVVNQMQNFISSLLASTLDGESLRILLVFDENQSVFNGFWDGTTKNPFKQQGLIDNERVFHFNQRTGSKWADIAFYRVFGPDDYVQSLPSVIPNDNPQSGVSVPLSSCSPTGTYYRPRVDPYTQDVGWPWTNNNFWNYQPCISSVQNKDLSDYLIPGAPVNVVTLSDDDLNANFDRFGFHPYDDNRNAYPEIIDLMFKDLVGVLGSSYHYHSIINVEDICTDPEEWCFQEIGTAHWALSQASGGSVFDIQLEDYTPIFNDLIDTIVYSSQGRDLKCTPVESSAKVFLNGQVMSSDTYTVNASNKRLTFKPEFFEGLQSGQSIEVKIQYQIK